MRETGTPFGASRVDMTSGSDEKPQVSKTSTGIGIAVGVGVGTALGVAFDQLALGVAFGAAFGAAIDVVSHVRLKDGPKAPG
jgi:uncharacterized membrane protein